MGLTPLCCSGSIAGRLGQSPFIVLHVMRGLFDVQEATWTLASQIFSGRKVLVTSHEKLNGCVRSDCWFTSLLFPAPRVILRIRIFLLRSRGKVVCKHACINTYIWFQKWPSLTFRHWNSIPFERNTEQHFIKKRGMVKVLIKYESKHRRGRNCD